MPKPRKHIIKRRVVHKTRHDKNPQVRKINPSRVTNVPTQHKRGGVNTGKFARAEDQIDSFAFMKGVTTGSRELEHAIRNIGSSIPAGSGSDFDMTGNRVHRTTLRVPKPSKTDYALKHHGGPKYYRPTQRALLFGNLADATERMTGLTNQPYEQGYLYEFHGDGTYTRHRDAEYHIDMMSGENVGRTKGGSV